MAAAWSDRRALYAMALRHVAFVLLPLVLTADVLYYCAGAGHIGAVDFHQEFWPAAHRVLQGLSPYDRSWQNIDAGVAFPYPALTAFAFVPLALISHAAADALFTALSIGAAILTLHVLAVRDWRLYGMVLLLSPVVNAWQTANLTLMLCLGVAWVWRERDRPLIAGALSALLISLKPFVWPLAVWLLITRRYRALGWTLALGVALNLVAWGLLGFDQIASYRALAQSVTAIMDDRGYSIVGFVTSLGATHTVGYALAVALAVTLILAAALSARRRSGDERALALCIGAALAATPVLWNHYFALLVIPLAIARPRVGVLWWLVLTLWACPALSPSPWQIAWALGVSGVVLGVIVRRPKADEQPGSPPFALSSPLGAAGAIQRVERAQIIA